jgi:hypothetical protein
MIKQLHCVLGLMILALSPAWAGKLYKWTDEDGTVHYSDKLPPDAVEKAHQEMNTHGVTTKSVNREKTKEEKLAEEVSNAAIEAEKKRVAEEEAKLRARDERLLSTYTTERDLLLARQEHLEAIDSIINLTTSNNVSLDQQAAAARKRVENLQKANKEVPENITKQVENLDGQLTKNKNFILAKQEERARLEQQFELDLARYRELKGVETLAEQQVAEQATKAAIGAGVKPPSPPKPAAADDTAKPEP